MQKKLEILPPSMPNFVFFKQKDGLKQEGFNTSSIPISEFTIDEAYEFAELMKQTFIKHWESKQKA